jgi:hypothetical protein
MNKFLAILVLIFAVTSAFRIRHYSDSSSDSPYTFSDNTATMSTDYDCSDSANSWLSFCEGRNGTVTRKEVYYYDRPEYSIPTAEDTDTQLINCEDPGFEYYEVCSMLRTNLGIEDTNTTTNYSSYSTTNDTDYSGNDTYSGYSDYSTPSYNDTTTI